MENKFELTISVLKNNGFGVQGYTTHTLILYTRPKELVSEAIRLYWLLLQEFDIELQTVESPYSHYCEAHFDPADPKYGIIRITGVDDKLLNSKGIFSVTRTKIESVTDIDNK